jgi:hypothetical protein
MSDPESLPAAEVSVEDAFVLNCLDCPTAKNLDTFSLRELAANIRRSWISGSCWSLHCTIQYCM